MNAEIEKISTEMIELSSQRRYDPNLSQSDRDYFQGKWMGVVELWEKIQKLESISKEGGRDLSVVPLTELFGEMFKRGKITGMVYIFPDEVYNWSKWDAEKTTQLDSDRVNGGCHILIVRDEPPTNKNWLQYYPVDMLVEELVKREGVKSYTLREGEVRLAAIGPARIIVVHGAWE